MSTAIEYPYDPKESLTAKVLREAYLLASGRASECNCTDIAKKVATAAREIVEPKREAKW